MSDYVYGWIEGTVGEPTYRRIYYKTLDRLLTALKSQHAQSVQQLLIQTGAIITRESTATARSDTLFGLGSEKTCLHARMFQGICQQRGIKLDSLADIAGPLQDASLRNILPDCVPLVKLLLTVPPTSCMYSGAEFYRSAATKDLAPPNHQPGTPEPGAVLTSYPDKLPVLDIAQEMREFASQTPRRVKAFGREEGHASGDSRGIHCHE